MIRKSFKIIFRTLAAIASFFALIYTGCNTGNNIYMFPKEASFTGDQYYNPYRGWDHEKTRLCNFHAHARAWGGITNGHDSREYIRERYKQAGYDVCEVSDYFHMSEEEEPNAIISVYEHGLNVGKHHQLVLNAPEVNWKEFPLAQSIHNKQTVINSIREDTQAVVALAHPAFTVGYSEDDLKKLTNYHLIEVLNHRKFSFKEWDAALSAGRPAFLIADDDIHDLSSMSYFTRNATLISSPTLEKDSLLNNLTRGNALGVEIYMGDGETLEMRRQKILDMEQLISAKMAGDTFKVSLSHVADTVRFYGREGHLMKRLHNTKLADYPFDPSDPYIRTVIDFPSRNQMYLNPVLRTTGGKPTMPTVQTDRLNTLLYRTMMFLAFASILILWIRWLRTKFKTKGKT
ncbi:MAG: hypothetical protein KDD36_07150 [Flavobacteriales bacterium]|nr:hypothetical protein [Flavobacteriales bacterium]